MLYSGIDLHKRTVVISTVDENGSVVTEASLPRQIELRSPPLP